MNANRPKTRKIVQTDVPRARKVSQEVWRTPLLRLLDVGNSEATPGGNAEGDGTS